MPLFSSPHPHIMNSLNSSTSPRYTFLVFYSNVENGQMWCPDCRDVEQTVKDAFTGDDKPKAIVYWAGSKVEWRIPENKARVDWNVQNLPTILRIESGKETGRLIEGEILDQQRLNEFINPQ